jgi:prepilin-type N-terminal cleavage/methylation domain-containing protein
MEKVRSEKGFTFLELIFVMVVTGILSSTLILPFTAGLKQGTRPEIYNTATYLAVEVLEEYKSEGYTYVKTNNSTLIGDPISPALTDVQLASYDANGNITRTRTYSRVVRAGYVDDPSDTSLDTSTATEYIKVTVTVSNSDIPNNVELWTILAKDFYDPDAN